jgi:hypothetical protein
MTPTSPGWLVQVNHEMAAVIERLQAAARAAQDGDTEAAAKVCGLSWTLQQERGHESRIS